VNEDEIRLMLKIGDRYNRHGGEEVDFDDFMYIMLQAKLYTEEIDGGLSQTPMPILQP